MIRTKPQLHRHHPTRVIHYPCEHDHVVEYYHNIPNCNRSPYAQSGPCVNEPDPRDNPHSWQATHYRLTTDTLDDTKGIRPRNAGCPVCGRENFERRWRAGEVFPSRLSQPQRPSASLKVERLTGLPKASRSSGTKGRGKEGEGGGCEASGDSGSNDADRELDDQLWLLEMPFLHVWERSRGKLVDTRGYRNLFPTSTHNRDGERYRHDGNYEGLNVGGFT